VAPVVLLLILFGLYKLANKGVPVTGEGRRVSTAALPKSVTDAMGNDRATKIQLETAASNAFNAGYEQLADALMSKAEKAPDRVFGFESPWRDVPSDKWTSFVKLMAVSAPAQEKDPLMFYMSTGRYGMFLMGVRRLVDLGIMTRPKKDAKGVWTAEWVMPKERFLGDPKVQLKAFVASMIRLRQEVSKRYGAAFGKNVEGAPATLSGLLAVAHYAGLEGLGKFLTGEVRKEAAVAAYKKANQIF
jgi:hypothetical protein